MGRHPRAIIEGGVYHVMNRGNRKLRIFEDDRDRRRFLRILIEEKETHGVDVLSGSQLDNHFHLIVATPYANLSEFMRQLQGNFARYSNWRHQHVGHVFQGRFRSVRIEHDVHLLIALCYVFLNPVSARLVAKPEDYRWSTYAASVGLERLPHYLSVDWLTSLFPSESAQDSQRQLRMIMATADPVAAYLKQLDVDPEAVRRVVRSYTGQQIQLASLPRMYRSALRPPLSELFLNSVTPQSRAETVYEAHVTYGYKLAEIARELSLHPSTVSKIFRTALKGRKSLSLA